MGEGAGMSPSSSTFLFRVFFASSLCASLFMARCTRAQETQEESRVVAQEPPNATEIHAQMAVAEGLLGKTLDRGAILYFLAASHALLQEPHAAIASLKQCIDLKEGFDPSGEPAFAGLKSSSDFTQLVEQAHKDFPSVAKSHLAFTTREKDLIPEGLAYDPGIDAFYLSSLHRRKIVKFPREGSDKGMETDFFPGERYHLLPVLGIRIDPSDGSVWSNSSTELGKSELLHFDRGGILLGRFPVTEEGKHEINDLVVLRNGEIFLTDTLAGKLYRFDPKTRTFTGVPVARELLLPNGIALADDQNSLYFGDQLGVLRVDLKTGESKEVDPGPHNTIAGMDGLYWHKGSLVAIQNGIGSARLAAFRLTPDGLRVAKTTILENRSRFTVLPTTGALRGDDFYFIVNSQLDNLNGERLLDVTKLEPVRIGVVTLP
jgi:hypothetical protein